MSTAATKETLPEPVEGHRPPLHDPNETRIVRKATGLLRTFNDAGVLGPADVHTALALAPMAGESDERVLLALALTVRALRVGSVCIDLRTVRDAVFDDSEELIDVSELPWPDATDWLAVCQQSPLVADGAGADPGRPLRLAYGLLYLERYWLQEETVRIELRQRIAGLPEVDLRRLTAGLDRIFSNASSIDGLAGESGLAPGEPDLQRRAAIVSALRSVTVVAGGPGTGKTTTVAKLLALLRDQPGHEVRIALAAPTGKAAARLEEAVAEARELLPKEDRRRLGVLQASTLHRLLGWIPSSRGRFRHHRGNRLPFDVVVVDEMSMVSLTLMSRLLEAVRPDARLILVGDPDQLSSVEAGAVLADIATAPGGAEPVLDDQLAGLGEKVTEPVRHGVVHLRHTWRYGGSIDRLAKAIRAGDAGAVIAELRAGHEDLTFAEVDLGVAHPEGLDHLRDQVRVAGRLVEDAARSGEVAAAVSALDDHRLLCAHRRGPFGVTRWGIEAEHWLTEAIHGYGEAGEWYLGRPLLVTANDYEMGLYNGDTGVVINTDRGVRAVFARGGTPLEYSPVRLDSVQTFHAMTVHRAQGSQFRRVSFIVPPAESPLLTRELLYTAVTRATESVTVLGSEAAIRRAVSRPANRASGLRNRLA